MSDRTCETCRFWDLSVQSANAQPDTTGLCRKKAPDAHPFTGMGNWPFTEDADWCGEHQARKEATADGR